MLKRKLLIISMILISMLGFYGCTSSSEISTPKSQIEESIKDYYTKSYDMWMNLAVEDLSSYLDLASVQSYNKTITLQENVEKWRYAIEKGYFKGERERHDINFEFTSVEITGDEAIVKVNLSGEQSTVAAYPFFVSLGDNTFKLKKHGDTWLIYEHDYSDAFFYERSKTEKIDFDIEKIHQEVDKDHQ